MRNQKGFTLIEVIVSLVLLGVIGSLAGFGIAVGMEAYLFARSNNEITHRAQFAMNRIRLELIHMDDVTAASADSISYTNTTRDPGIVYTITRTGDQITISDGGTPRTLMDGLGAYEPGDSLFDYTANDNSPWSAPPTNPFRELFAVEVLLPIAHPELGDVISFQTTINPRGNGARNAPKPIRHDQ